MSGGRRLGLARRIVAAASFLVAGRDRQRWRHEWNGELSGWRRTHRRPGDDWVLLRRALLSPFDAVAFRHHLSQPAAAPFRDRSPRARRTCMDNLLADLRFAVRSARQRPGLTAVLLLTLGLGIGANTAIFSLLHGVVLAPLPYPRPERIVQVWPARSRSMSKEMLVGLQQETDSYERLAAWSEEAFKLPADGRTEMVFGPRVTAELFAVLGARAELGRLFVAGDDRRGPRHVVLSYDFWQRRFSGDRGVLGRRLTLSGVDHTVVGVVERGFALPRGAFDVAVPHLVEADTVDFDGHYLDIVGRLRPGVGLEHAHAELRALARRWAARQGVSPDFAQSASVVGLQEVLIGDVRPLLVLLAGAVGCVLLIVVANVSNLLLFRSLARRQEVSVRAALGASRGRLARQLLTETGLLAVAGGALGIGLARLAMVSLAANLPAEVPRLAAVRLSPQVLLFSLALTLGTGLLVGLAPVLQVARSGLRRGLAGDRRSGGPRRGHLRAGLVAAEVTLAVLLLAGASVLLRSFWNTLRVDPGVRTAGLVQLQILPGPSEWGSPSELEGYYQALRDHLAAVPGVIDAATVHAVPVADTGWVMGTYPVESPPADGEMPPLARWRPVGPEYFRTAGVRLLAGRPFEAGDREESEPVVILNETAARAFFGDRDPLDRWVRIGFEGDQPLRVVGVAADVKILGLRQPAPLTAYRPFAQSSVALHRIGVYDRSIVVRVELPLPAMADDLRTAIAAVDPQANLLALRSMDQIIGASLARSRAVLVLLASFAAVSLLLGAIGIHGVIGQAVGERLREMAIRIAVGAPAGRIRGSVVLAGMRPVLLGLALGGALAVPFTGLLAAELFEVAPADPLSLGAAALLLGAAALVAAYLPARQAGRVDPLEILRAE